jgi:entericidin B
LQSGPLQLTQPDEEITMIRKLFAALIAAGLLAGCNTVAGLGKDVERGGEKLQDAAEKAKN